MRPCIEHQVNGTYSWIQSPLGLDRYRYRVSADTAVSATYRYREKNRADTDTINYLCSTACSSLKAAFTATVGIGLSSEHIVH